MTATRTVTITSRHDFGDFVGNQHVEVGLGDGDVLKFQITYGPMRIPDGDSYEVEGRFCFKGTTGPPAKLRIVRGRGNHRATVTIL